MGTKTIQGHIKMRNATESAWTTANPVLLAGELAVSTDRNGRYKVGDGTSRWSQLNYAGLIVGSNLTLTNDTISLSQANVVAALGYTPPTQNTTYAGATTNAAGLMPALDGSTSKYLRGDGTWVTPPDNNTTYANATTSAAGLMSSDDKTKLNGIATGANNYVLPEASTSTRGGVTLGGGTANYLRADGSWATPPDNNTTYANATTSAAGLMSSDDKTKLNGIANNANNYSLPAATSSARGGVTLDGDGTNFLSGDGTWKNPNTVLVSTAANGLAPQLPASNTNQVLHSDGTWKYISIGYGATTSALANAGADIMLLP